MSLQDVENSFPALKADGYEKTSEETEQYNCFAFATSEADKWVDPTGLYGAYCLLHSGGVKNMDIKRCRDWTLKPTRKLRICHACECPIDENGCGCNPSGA